MSKSHNIVLRKGFIPNILVKINKWLTVIKYKMRETLFLQEAFFSLSLSPFPSSPWPLPSLGTKYSEMQT